METIATPSKEIFVPLNDVQLPGNLTIPHHANTLVIFSHGSGSSRLSPRNNRVAHRLNDEGIGTFLFDLLTEEEDFDYENRFNIDLLTNRLVQVTKWLMNQESLREMSLGYFGASTGAASALNAAAQLGNSIKAVVSRGGRPDLSIPNLPKVVSPVLLIVGGLDDTVIELNQKAYDHITCEKQLAIIPGATHLFEEPGTLEQVAQLSAHWFETHLK